MWDVIVLIPDHCFFFSIYFTYCFAITSGCKTSTNEVLLLLNTIFSEILQINRIQHSDNIQT